MLQTGLSTLIRKISNGGLGKVQRLSKSAIQVSRLDSQAKRWPKTVTAGRKETPFARVGLLRLLGSDGLWCFATMSHRLRLRT
jgi:hypothetical protein